MFILKAKLVTSTRGNDQGSLGTRIRKFNYKSPILDKYENIGKNYEWGTCPRKSPPLFPAAGTVGQTLFEKK
jgi:hypothetical protein